MRRHRKQAYSRLGRRSYLRGLFGNVAAAVVGGGIVSCTVLDTSDLVPSGQDAFLKFDLFPQNPDDSQGRGYALPPQKPERDVKPATSLGMNGVDDRQTLTINSSVYNSLIHMESNAGTGCSSSLVDLSDYGLVGDFVVTAGHCVVHKDTDRVYESQTLTLDGYDHAAGRYMTYQWDVDQSQVFIHPDYIANSKDPHYTQFDIAIVRVGSEAQPMPDWALALPVDTTFNPDISDGEFCSDRRINVFGFPYDYKVVHDNDRQDDKRAVAHYGALTDQCVSGYQNQMTMRSNAFTSQGDKGSGESGGLTAIVKEGRSVLVAVNSSLSGGYGYENSSDPDQDQKFRQSIHVGIWAFDEYWDYAVDHFDHAPFPVQETMQADKAADPLSDPIQSLDQG